MGGTGECVMQLSQQKNVQTVEKKCSISKQFQKITSDFVAIDGSHYENSLNS